MDNKIPPNLGPAELFLISFRNEIYEAAKRGVIDAFEVSAPALDYARGFHEVAKYIYLSPVRQPGELYFHLVSRDSWAALPDNLKVLLEDAFLAEAWRIYAEITLADTKAIEKFIAYGCKVEPIAKDIEDEMTRLTEKFYAEQAAKDPLFAQVIKSISEFQKAYRATWPRL